MILYIKKIFKYKNNDYYNSDNSSSSSESYNKPIIAVPFIIKNYISI